MEKYILAFKKWYELLLLREQLLLIALSWVIIYAFLNLLFFSSLNAQAATLSKENKKLQDEMNSWQTQIMALNKIANSPLYQKWRKEHSSFLNYKSGYKAILNTSPTKQWQDMIRTLSKSQNNITLEQIKNSPEVTYTPEGGVTSENTIYQQRISLTVTSSYFDMLTYLQRLEEVLPSIHWDSLNYQVTKYPNARVDMEFSIFYEKTAQTK